MPTVTFLGPFYTRRGVDYEHAEWIRGQPVEVTQEWLNQWRYRLPESKFKIEGDEGVTEDAGNDGIPDEGWARSDILAWLKEQGVSRGSGYLTKTAALALVDKHLNPPVEETETEEGVE